MNETAGLRRVLALLAMLVFLAPCSTNAIDAGRYGHVNVVQPHGPARAVVIFFSGSDGWTREDSSAANALSSVGAMVAEIDTRAYSTQLDKSAEQCYRLIGDAEWLSRGLQREAKLPTYLTPIVLGVGEGGTFAELTLSEAMAVTIAGAISIDPAAEVATNRPICTELPTRRTHRGFRYGAPKKMHGFWIVGLTPAVRKSDRDHLLALQRAGAPFELRQLARNQSLGQEFTAFVEPHLAPQHHPTGDIARLPITELQVSHPSKVMAIVLSGDGGWRDLDRTIAEQLQRHGVPVVGWDSLRYFWSKKTPEQTASDLATVIETFTQRWHAERVALIGYSFGADVLPFAYNRLPGPLRSQVALISLLGLSKSADFEITISGWLGEPPGSDALPIAPEVERVPASLMQCFYGQDEDDSDCPTLAKRGVETIKTSGGHHFDGNYAALAAQIISRLNRPSELHQRVAR